MKEYDLQSKLEKFVQKSLDNGVSLFDVSKSLKTEAARIDAAVMEMSMKASAKAVAESLL